MIKKNGFELIKSKKKSETILLVDLFLFEIEIHFRITFSIIDYQYDNINKQNQTEK